jgi:hypothetical protein
MANYTFLNKETNEEFDISMPISDLDDYKKNNPHLEQLLTGMRLGDPTRLGLRKPDAGFRDVLKKVKRAHRGSTVNTW